jgi:23S rRNA (cytidine1920-2'-O)/16S rRNA (cytidine1409-2'-O)-methyltransferase
MADRRRADQLLVERGLFASRAQAQAAIAAGLVTANAVVITKPSTEIPIDAALHASPAHPWVSRGGVKLAAALEQSGIDVKGRVCLDVGASTGGFSDVLLARGARLVYAVDVGHGQLHERLRTRADLISFEHTDIRRLDAARLPERPEVVVIDVSFISLKLVLPAALALAARRMQLLALIKPQFEAPRRSIKKGIVRDPAIHDAVCNQTAAFVGSLGCTVSMLFPSEIAGSDGNREFFIAAHRD